MKYLKPMDGDFIASARPPAADHWRRLLATMARGRMARIAIAAELTCADQLAGTFDGRFVILPD